MKPNTTTFTARITDDWIPIPADTRTLLGWREGDSLTLEVVGDCLLVKLTHAHHECLAPPAADRPRGLLHCTICHRQLGTRASAH